MFVGVFLCILSGWESYMTSMRPIWGGGGPLTGRLPASCWSSVSHLSPSRMATHFFIAIWVRVKSESKCYFWILDLWDREQDQRKSSRKCSIFFLSKFWHRTIKSSEKVLKGGNLKHAVNLLTLIGLGEVIDDLANFYLKLQENLFSNLISKKYLFLQKRLPSLFELLTWPQKMTFWLTFWRCFVRNPAAAPPCRPPPLRQSTF